MPKEYSSRKITAAALTAYPLMKQTIVNSAPGTATEFRLAGVNEYGTGPYIHCKPSPDLSGYCFTFVISSVCSCNLMVVKIGT